MALYFHMVGPGRNSFINLLESAYSSPILF